MTENSSPLSFYAHGKLLLTAEYFVLDGAQALALPTKLGQRMSVRSMSSISNKLFWKAYNTTGDKWLEIEFDKTTLLANSSLPEAARLTTILQTIKKYQADFLVTEKDVLIETFLEFPNSWGLGSSSTLISLLAQYARVSPYAILAETIGGSGYDIACATADSAILYLLENGLPNVEHVSFSPPFKEQLYFVYLGQKQLSSKAINDYKNLALEKTATIKWLSKITTEMIQCQSLEKMNQLIEEHERFVGDALKMPLVKSLYFSDYWGAVKSLGAWGGDFVMMTNDRPRDDLTAYLATKKMNVVFSFDELILP